MKRILLIILWTVLIGGLCVLLGFVESTQQKMICTAVNIKINTDTENEFVVEEDIRNIIRDRGEKVIGQQLRKINIPKLEMLLKNNPAIENAEVYASVKGKINIDIEQREPIIRIQNTKDEGFYIDRKGTLMPLSEKYTARVMIANGYITDSFGNNYKRSIVENDSLMKTSVLDELYYLASFIDTSDFWKAQIAQVYINQKKEAELVPRVGNHVILLGDLTDIEKKFSKLMLFYKEAAKTAGWNSYSIINLKYENQVVCTKRQ